MGVFLRLSSRTLFDGSDWQRTTSSLKASSSEFVSVSFPEGQDQPTSTSINLNKILRKPLL
jgi:hypothetical protein